MLQVIKERRKMAQNGSLENKCFLDALLKISDNNDNFSEEDCIQEACTLMLAVSRGNERIFFPYENAREKNFQVWTYMNTYERVCPCHIWTYA